MQLQLAMTSLHYQWSSIIAKTCKQNLFDIYVYILRLLTRHILRHEFTPKGLAVLNTAGAARGQVQMSDSFGETGSIMRSVQKFGWWNARVLCIVQHHRLGWWKWTIMDPPMWWNPKGNLCALAAAGSHDHVMVRLLSGAAASCVAETI